MSRSRSPAPTLRSPASSAIPTRTRICSRRAHRSPVFCRPPTIVVYNGADYDPWMAKLLAAARSPNRRVIVVAEPRAQEGRRQSASLVRSTDDAGLCQGAGRNARRMRPGAPGRLRADGCDAFLASLQPLEAKIADLRNTIRRHRRSPPPSRCSATWPPHSGFKMRNERFQLAVMNDTEPRASDVAAFENDLRKHAVRLLFYNSQATDAACAAPAQDRPSNRRFRWSA